MTHHSNTPSDPPHEDPRYDEPDWMHEPNFPGFALQMFYDMLEDGEAEWPWGEIINLDEIFQQEIWDLGHMTSILHTIAQGEHPLNILMEFDSWRKKCIKALEVEIATKARSK